MNKKFQDNLLFLRQNKSISQAKLAKELGVSKGIISLWENGKREPKSTQIILIAKYFGVTTDYLLGLED